MSTDADVRMSDSGAISYINRRLREEGIRIKDMCGGFDLVGRFSLGAPLVSLNTTPSKEGNYFRLFICNIYPTESELGEWLNVQRRGRTLNLVSPSELIKDGIEINVQRYLEGKGEDIGELLAVELRGGSVTKLWTPRVSPFYDRLKVQHPLETALNVAIEAYHTRYNP